MATIEEWSSRLRTYRDAWPDGTVTTTSTNIYFPTRRDVVVRNLGPKPKGWKSPKPYSAMYRTLKPIAGSGSYAFREPAVYQRSWTGGAGLPGDLMFSQHFSVPDELVAQAESDALSALKGMKMDIGAAFAEGRETCNMIADVAGRLYNGYRAARTGNLGAALRGLGYRNPRKFINGVNGAIGAARATASGWLYFNWGVLPLLSDVDSAIQGFLSNEPWRFAIIGRGAASDVLPEKEFLIGGFPNSPDYIKATAKVEASVRVSIYAYPDTNFFRDMSQWGLTNPPSAVWNGLMLTAVVDYFLPIGDWLSNLDAGVGMRFLGSHTSRRLRVTADISGGRGPDGSRVKGLKTSYTGRFEETSLLRTTGTRFPSSKPMYFKNPLEGSGSLKRAANMAAVLTGFLSGGYKPGRGMFKPAGDYTD